MPEVLVPAIDGGVCPYDYKVFLHGSEVAKDFERLDLYKKGSFVLEVKQGRYAGASVPPPAQTSSVVPVRGTRQWEEMMRHGWRQAEQCARCLPRGEVRPPFVIVADVGHCFDLYADFSCTGGSYLHFPDPRNFRFLLEDLAENRVQDLFRSIWSDPGALDPSRYAARVTEEVSAHLASLARSLEADGHDQFVVSQFLMRCVFTMFAEDVRLIPQDCFTEMLRNSLAFPDRYQNCLRDLWKSMDEGCLSLVAGCKLMRLNGNLFADPQVLPLNREQTSLLYLTSLADWKEVEPSIFGTLLERALNPGERHRLGAHYTPRAYVHRLVVPTVMQPLRREWEDVQVSALSVSEAGKGYEACELIRSFHDRLCGVRVLDPACGTGNFLYVTMELMKRLECEVFDVLASYGERQTCHLEVDPRQFLGLEINPRAASIAEMVLWIGYLQWYVKTHSNAEPPEPPILEFNSIQCRDALIDYKNTSLVTDKSDTPIELWNEEMCETDPVTGRQVPIGNASMAELVYERVAPAEWPKADYIVGNPPFVGGSAKRGTLGRGYLDALTKCYDDLPEACDLVMYWWHKAALLVRAGLTRRFGFITTNSIRQLFNRRVVAMHIEDNKPLRLLFAIPDHPWVNASDGAAVRIAMTVCGVGDDESLLASVVREQEVFGRELSVVLRETVGQIHSDLSQGADVTSALPLSANVDLCSRGMYLFGTGFVVSPGQAVSLGLGRIRGLDDRIRQFRNGKDLTSKPRYMMVIDMFGLSVDEVMERFPEVYDWLLARVKPERDHNSQKNRRVNWWLFGDNSTSLRSALVGLPRYIATVETAKHRVFVFLSSTVLPDSTLVVVASPDAMILGILSSRIHVCWSLASGGRLVDRPRYSCSRCFATFPFPNATASQEKRIRRLGEQIDAHRNKQQNLFPDLTLTGLYNVLDAVRSGRSLTSRERSIHNKGLVVELRNLHDDLDLAVAEAYGWPVDLPDVDILSRLVALNAERAEEERNGIVRWLRPEYQSKDHSTYSLELA